FKMTPIHHHFELSNWSEWKIVIVFSLVGLVAGIIGVFLGVEYMNRYKDKNIIVVGYGRRGRSEVHAIKKLGARVTLTNNKNLVDEAVLEDLRKETVQIVDGHHPTHLLNDADLIVKNPGIPFRIPFLQEAIERNVPIITEVELAYELHKKEIIGITGTNGKTTVSTLIGEMLTDETHHPIL